MLLYEDETAVARVYAANAAVSANPLREQRFQSRYHSDALVLAHFEKLFFVVEYDEYYRGAADIVEVLRPLEVGNVVEIKHKLLRIFDLKHSHRYGIDLFFLFYLKSVAGC